MELIDLLKQARYLDAKRDDPKVVPPAPVKVGLFDEQDDPFGGNLNNRRVAQGIAETSKSTIPGTANGPIVGDAAKAAAAVELSKTITPEPPAPEADAPAHPFGPPTGAWKPNA